MKCVFLKLIIVLIISLGIRFKVYSQDTLVNQYSYVHPIKNRVVISTDSFKVKIGFWIESDTIFSISGDLFNSAQINIINQSPMILTAKGNYTPQGKSGFWNYYNTQNVLVKQVNFFQNELWDLKCFYPNGNIQMIASVRGNNILHYENYSISYKKIAEGDIPIELIKSLRF